jgi:trk system potassium uptake protein
METNGDSQLFFIIGGAGRVGYFLAKKLIEQGHEVMLLDKDPKRVHDLKRELGAQVTAGDACEVATLDRVGCARADYVLAVTGEDEDNLVICQVAKSFRHPSKPKRVVVARVNNIEFISFFKELGVDIVISPTQNILDGIANELPMAHIAKISPTTQTGPSLVEFHIHADAPANGQTVAQFALPPGNAIVLLMRGDQNITPAPDTTILDGDRLYAVVDDHGRQMLEAAIISNADHSVALT